MWGRSEPNPEINTSSLYVLSEAISWMRTLPEGILRKAASGSFVTYFLCFPLPALLSPSFSPQRYEESQLKRTRGKSHTERFGRLQGQPNPRRIHRQQFQRQKKWQVNIMLKSAFCPHMAGGCLCFDDRFIRQKTLWSPYFKSMVYLEVGCWMTAVCLLPFALQQTEGSSVQCR